MTPRCWCGGEVAPRDPGDANGLGCTANVMHDWRGSPLDCRNCEDIDPGPYHALDEFCGADKCAPWCEFTPPHPRHPCGKYPKEPILKRGAA